MGWVTLTLRKRELKQSHAYYQMRDLQISREKRQLARQKQYETAVIQNNQEKALLPYKTSYNEAMDEYNQAVDNNNQVFTSENESKIAFYDKLFNAIVDNGWEYNNNISDDDYLNQMLQNNQFLITTMDRSIDDDGNTFYEYDSAIASNFGNLVSVNDSDAANEALAEYEYQKSIINEKESRIDTRMQDLETEQSAINEMIKGIETVRNDNVERTFSIFS